MLEATLATAATLKRLMDAIKELVSDTNFDCDEYGIRMKGMDNSGVATVFINLHSSSFKSFQCTRSFTLGLIIGSFVRVLEYAKDDREVALKVDNEKRTLTLTYTPKASERVADHPIGLLEIEGETLEVPDVVEYHAEVEMSASEFASICEKLEEHNDLVRIKVTMDSVEFVGPSDESTGAILSRPEELSLNVKRNVSLVYSLYYMNEFAKCSSFADKVKLSFSEDHPLCVRTRSSNIVTADTIDRLRLLSKRGLCVFT